MATFKILFKGDLRRFTLDEESLRWSNFIEEIVARFKIPHNSPFVLTYIDQEGDFISFSGEKEFSELVNNINRSEKTPIRLELTISQTKILQRSPSEHSICCAVCKKSIHGLRLKCGHCESFDLCHNCESKNLHDPSHIFLKIPNPIFPTHPAWLSNEILLPPLHQQLAPAVQNLSTSSNSQTPNESNLKFVSKCVENGNLEPICVRPGGMITKSWKLKNTGDQKWPTGTRLRFIRGEQMTTLTTFLVPLAIPQQEVVVSVTLKAPKTVGQYSCFWQLCYGQHQFGDIFECSILVSNETEKTLENHEEESLQLNSLEEPNLLQPLVLPTPDDERYEGEMKYLLNLGFGNRARNFQLLRKYAGDTEKVLSVLNQDFNSGWRSD